MINNCHFNLNGYHIQNLDKEYTVEPQYSAHDWEISKSMLYQSVHYIEVLYNITLKLNLNHSRHTI